jgi:hypothetical protein
LGSGAIAVFDEREFLAVNFGFNCFVLGFLVAYYHLTKSFEFEFIVRESPSVSMDSRVPELGSVKTIESMSDKFGPNCVSSIIVGEEFKE